jgi:hypothetical protein
MMENREIAHGLPFFPRGGICQTYRVEAPRSLPHPFDPR